MVSRYLEGHLNFKKKFTMEGKDNPRAINTFFHKSIDVSEWMKDKISYILKSRGYTILLMDVNTETMTRMSKLTVINTIKLKFKDKEESVYSINNYSSLDKEYDGGNDLKWLVDAIKEFETEALLKFGGSTLKTIESEEYTPQNVIVKSCEEKYTDDLRMDVYINSSVSEMMNILTSKEHISRWTLNGRFDGDSVSFENVILKDIKPGKSSVSMKYKWDDWKEFSEVKIVLDQAGDCVKMSLKQEGIPVKYKDNVREHWNSRIFFVISRMFNCAIKPVY